MHAACATFVAEAIERHDRLHGPFRRVLEIGSRNVNGSVRSLFGPCDYVGIDLDVGEGVDFQHDATTPWPDWLADFDAIVCTNVLEHVLSWTAIVNNAAKAMPRGGWFIVTAPGPDFPPHSAVDGCELRPGEWYAGIRGTGLITALQLIGLDVEVAHFDPMDTRAVGIKR
jgi:hypothetical protein